MTSEQQLGCEGGPLNSWHLARVPFQSQMSKFIILTLCPAAIVVQNITQTTSSLLDFCAIYFSYTVLAHCNDVNQIFPFSIQFSCVMLTFKSIIVQYLVSQFSMCLTNPHPVFI